jgi:ABC-type Zn uptake system ZnuABC Zn-binding protein ZnuA
MRALALPLLACCALAWGVALAAGAIAGGDDDPAVQVVATTSTVADLVRRAGGGEVQVRGLLPAGADPHAHDLRPSDVRALDGAALVVRSGGEVDDWIADVAGDTPVLDLSDHVRLRGEDPHWWQDPRNGARAAIAIGRALGTEAAARAYARRVAALDTAIERCWSAVPAQRRRLVTTHDSYGYYAARYGLEVAGAVIPSLSSRGQPSARGLSRLVRTIRRERIRAVFTESALGARVERAVAREGGARVGRRLTGDALPRGTSYLEALASDTRALIDGLAGPGAVCDL